MPKLLLPCFAAWLVPGAGHLLLGKWGRGIVFFATIALLFALGLVQDGELFALQPGFFGFLKFFANVSTGTLYLIGKSMGLGQGDIHSFAYEYGNTFLYTAGLLNLLLVVDTFDIAKGRKS